MDDSTPAIESYLGSTLMDHQRKMYQRGSVLTMSREVCVEGGVEGTGGRMLCRVRAKPTVDSLEAA
eukprot:358391-Chlamydomonas_euryale.AAC.2